ncbi:glycoside hydrolase domain-containing protein, partial [Brevibacterium linens]
FPFHARLDPATRIGGSRLKPRIQRRMKGCRLLESGEVGFGIAPIWQTSANDAAYFISGRGTTDAQAAHTRAEALGIPGNVNIYFAVDFGAFGDTIDDLIVPYFQELDAETTALGGNPIGVYGPRAVCNRMEQ